MVSYSMPQMREAAQTSTCACFMITAWTVKFAGRCQRAQDANCTHSRGVVDRLADAAPQSFHLNFGCPSVWLATLRTLHLGTSSRRSNSYALHRQHVKAAYIARSP